MMLQAELTKALAVAVAAVSAFVNASSPPQSPANGSASARPKSAARSADQPAAVAAAPHRITADARRLFDSVTGQVFRPRGANYVLLNTSPHGVTYHSTFEPGKYSSAEAQAVLDGMQNASGYNTVRVFIDPGDGHFDHGLTKNPAADGLSHEYIKNFADFVNRAAAHNIYVYPDLSRFPVSKYYMGIVNSTDGGNLNPNVSGDNRWFMDRGFIAAKKAYVRNFITALKPEVKSNISAILAYQTENEAFWDTAEKPFNTMSGSVTGPDGLTYNMAKSADRQQAADASMVIYQNAAVDGIQAVQSDALVSMGFFTMQAVGKPGYDGFATHCSASCVAGNRYRYPGRPASIARWSKSDFVDVHAYPQGGSYSLSADLGSAEVTAFTKPFIIGELGAYKPAYNNDITRAAYDMRDKQVQSCTIAKGAQGWLFWTYNTDVVAPNLADQNLFYSLADNRGAINGQLATVARPNPCQQ